MYTSGCVHFGNYKYWVNVLSTYYRSHVHWLVASITGFHFSSTQYIRRVVVSVAETPTHCKSMQHNNRQHLPFFPHVVLSDSCYTNRQHISLLYSSILSQYTLGLPLCLVTSLSVCTCVADVITSLTSLVSLCNQFKRWRRAHTKKRQQFRVALGSRVARQM